MSEQLPAEIAPANRLLTAAEFHRLADVPPEVEWFANITNGHTRRAYENAVKDFMRFTGIRRPEEFRTVTRAHIIAWRDELASRSLGGSTIRHRLASLASLFEYLCERNAVTHNPVKGVGRPKSESGEGKTPALGDHQARKLLEAPPDDTIKSKRDRAIGELHSHVNVKRLGIAIEQPSQKQLVALNDNGGVRVAGRYRRLPKKHQIWLISFRDGAYRPHERLDLVISRKGHGEQDIGPLPGNRGRGAQNRHLCRRPGRQGTIRHLLPSMF